MDANPLSPFYIKLKLHTINILTREEFITFFVDRTNKSFVHKTLFKEKLQPTLGEPLRTFWNTMYEKGSQDKLYNLDGTLKDLPLYLINDEN